MNDNNGYNSNVTPYKASGNLNTAIENPSVNINDTMNVNIQSMVTNRSVMTNNGNSNVQNQVPISNNQDINNGVISTNNIGRSNNLLNNNEISGQQVNNQSGSFVNKTYVTVDNKPKKKNVSLKLGSEFKVVLLIVIILMIFIFLLPIITDLFNGY